MDENSQNEKPKPWRRLGRFSLRFLFVVMTIIAIYLGMLTVRARHQRQVVDMVLQLGGQVTYLHSRTKPDDPKEVDFNLQPPGPDWLRNLVGQDYFLNVVLIHLQGKNITDDQLGMIAKLPYLDNLTLSDTQITDKGIAHLKNVKNLRVLFLSRTKIGDAGVAHLAGLTNLMDLHLNETNITDAGLVHLSGLVNLSDWLNLANTQVTDTGIQHLRGLKKLMLLNLGRTKVTEEGAKSLHQHLPNTIISFGENKSI